jgi:hypothetical protein
MRKSILIDEQLHDRLKAYTAKQNLLLGKYVENCINDTLTQDELEIDDRWIQLQEQFKNLMKKIQISGGGFVEESDEYKQYINDVKKYWNEK